jgi:hypothetical protein
MSIVSHLLAGPSLGPWALSLSQRLSHHLELSCHAAVIHGAANLRDGAANDRRIYTALELNLAPRGVCQSLLQRRDAISSGPTAVTIRPHNLRAISPILMAVTISGSKTSRSRSASGSRSLATIGDVDPARARSWSAAASLRSRNRRVGEVRQGIVTGDQPGEAREVAAGLLDVAFFPRHVEQRSRVPGGGCPARHRASLSCAA